MRGIFVVLGLVGSFSLGCAIPAAADFSRGDAQDSFTRRNYSRPAGGGNTGSASAPIPGNFDVYILAMSYENDFCLNRPEKPECGINQGKYGMVLHGLWPNVLNDPKHTYAYCGIPAEKVGKNWCDREIDISSKLSSSELAALTEVMPGAQSCLHNYQWHKHGSCSGLEVGQFYREAESLARKFRGLKGFNGFIRDNARKSVTRQEMMDALASDLGEAGRDAVVLQCRRDGKKVYFVELHMTLLRNELQKFPNAGALGVNESWNKPSCPETGITISP